MAEAERTPEKIYGLIAEFTRPEALLEATRRTRAAGYRRFEAYSPFPIGGLADATGYRAPGIAWLTLGGGILGFFSTLLLQWWINVVDYPINVGGRPLASWPAFMLPAFEGGVLFAAFFAVGGMLIMNRLPRLTHPVFRAPRFNLVTEDRFFLVIERSDPHFDAERTRTFLQTFQPLDVSEIPA